MRGVSIFLAVKFNNVHHRKGVGLVRALTQTYTHTHTHAGGSLKTSDLGQVQAKEWCKKVSVRKLHRAPPPSQRALPEPRRIAREKAVAVFMPVPRCLHYCPGAPYREFAAQILSVVATYKAILGPTSPVLS